MVNVFSLVSKVASPDLTIGSNGNSAKEKLAMHVREIEKVNIKRRFFCNAH